MSIQTKWLDDRHTTIVREFTGKWTWAEFHESQRQIIEMLNSVRHKVYQIVDFSQSPPLPPNALGQVRDSLKEMPENRSKSFVVMNALFYKQAYYVVSTIFPNLTKNVVVVGTMQEALDKLREYEANDEGNV
jgi:hypothetical protein